MQMGIEVEYNIFDQSDSAEDEEDASEDELASALDECKHLIDQQTSRLLFDTSLQNLCLNTVIQNLNFFANPAYEYTLSHLPRAYREKLLLKINTANFGLNDGELMNLGTMFLAVDQLLSSETTDFSLDWTDRYFYVHRDEYDLNVDKVYKLLANHFVSNIKKLTHGAEGDMKKRIEVGSQEELPHLTQLIKLTNLVHLKLRCCLLKNAHFKEISKTLVNLEYLSCELFKPFNDCIMAGVKRMVKLQVFEFRVWDNRTYDKKIQEVDCSEICCSCLEECPELKVIGSKVDIFEKIWNGEPYPLHYYDDTGGCLEEGPPSKLQHFATMEPFHDWPCGMVPNVSALSVDIAYSFEDEQFKHDLNQFENITSLTLVERRVYQGSNRLFDVIQRFGPQLKTLNLANYADLQTTFEQILPLCPNLEIFGLHWNHGNENRPSVIFAPDLLSKLKRVSIDHIRLSDTSEIFCQLLTAPRLTYLHVVLSTYNSLHHEYVLETLQQLQQESNIGPELRELKLEVGDDCNADEYDLLPACQQLLGFIVSRAPQLRRVSIHFKACNHMAQITNLVNRREYLL